MGDGLTILYRGPLSSCNYDCGYCPFAKRQESPAELDQDRRALERFVEWAAHASARPLSVLFTPWGEALIRPWYHEAMARLTALPHVRRVAAQTNLSFNPDRLAACDRARLALWCTYHPAEVAMDRFLNACARLDGGGLRYSVGAVGIREHIAQIEQLRVGLSADTYLWINAYKRPGPYYTSEDLRRLTDVDPLFPLNTLRYASLGRACQTGSTVISVDGDGDVRRCHFVDTVIGNLYRQHPAEFLAERPCPAERCSCYIGYTHLNDLGLYPLYGDGLLERIPARPVWRDAEFRRQAELFVKGILAAESAPPASLTLRGLPLQVSTAGS